MGPIGNDTTPFRAEFQGNKHTIANLFINRPTVLYLGLFAQTLTPAEISYLRLTNVNVTGKHDVGALVGHMTSGEVSYSYSEGSVTAAGHNGALSIGDSKVGGLVGSTYSSAAVVKHSYSTADVSGVGHYVGGLVGSNGGAIIASYATGAVQGDEDKVGGLAGGNSGTITASYANGAAEGDNEVGGLAGSNSGTITASYANGAVSSTNTPAGSDVGGLTGTNTGTVTNSYWDTTTSGQSGGGGKTTSELQTPTAYGSSPSIYANWNVNTDGVAGADDSWDFGTANQYPALQADFDRNGRPTAGEFGRQRRSAPVDYDSDDDGLVEVSNLDQLHAIRWDMNGNGRVASQWSPTLMAAAFPNSFRVLGCPLGDHDDDATSPNEPHCIGYELTQDLDFDSTGEGKVDADDHGGKHWHEGAGWAPIGMQTSASPYVVPESYTGVFKGNGFAIHNMTINRPNQDYVGLFAKVGWGGKIKSLGLVDVDITGKRFTGGLAGTLEGQVRQLYVTGRISGTVDVGGMAGAMASPPNHARLNLNTMAYITRSYVHADLTARGDGGASTTAPGVVEALRLGGIAGRAMNRIGILNVYFAGTLTGTPAGTVIGGVVGASEGISGANFYYDFTRFPDPSGKGARGMTTAELQAPTSITEDMDLTTPGMQNPYSIWASSDWDFGTASEYPALKFDSNEDGTSTWQEFGRQRRVATVDYDDDNDNLIEIDSLDQLNALRWDLDGNGRAASGERSSHETAFPNPAPGMGCPATCTGYELEADLNFNTDTSTDVSGEAVIDDKDAYWNSGSGWEPIGSDANTLDSERYNAVFAGNGHTISNLFINRTSTGDVGLFGSTGASSEVRMVGLEDVDVTGQGYVGGLVGSAYGDIRSAYTTGSVAGSSIVGGLAGSIKNGEIRLSYSNAAVTASSNYTGGLVAYPNNSSIVAGYATGAVSGADYVGGLAGYIASSSVVAGYATGEVTGTNDVGGLVGSAGLASTVTNSYWDTTTSGQANSPGGGTGKTTSELQTPTAYGSGSDIYANWNVNVDKAAGADDPWDFGTSSQYPVLKADFDGNNSPTWQEFGRQKRSAPNLAPAFATATATRAVAENTAAGADIGNPITAADPNVGDTLTYSLGTTADDRHFAIIAASGQLQTKNALNYEAKNTYTVTVSVSDGKNAAGNADASVDDTINVTINVTDVNEAPVFADVSITRTVAENTTANTDIGNPIVAPDPDAGASVTYTLDTSDGANFAIHSATGQLKTKNALDYETTTSYTLTVTASDGALDATISVTVNVTDVDEPPGAPTELTVTPGVQSLSVSWVAPDAAAMSGRPPVNGYDVQYKLSSDSGWSSHSHSGTGTGAQITGLTPGSLYNVQARAKNDEGDSGWTSGSGTPTAPLPGNNAPIFTDGPSKTFTIAEGTTAVGTVPATDPDGDTRTYSLDATGDHAAFNIVSGTGQLTLKQAADYERKTSYSVTVSVSDGRSGSDSINVTVNVTDVAEPPSPPTGLTVTPGVQSLSVSWVAPDAVAMDGKPPVTGYDVEYKLSSASGWTSHSHSGTGTSAQITGLTAGSLYDVEVRSKNAEGDSSWNSGSATPTAPAPGNNPPTFNEGSSASRSVAENTAAGQNIGSPVDATDVDNDALAYALGGTNANHFAIDSATGQLQASGGLDYENKSSYSVTVTVSDGRSGSDSIDVTINVTDVDETTTPPTGVNRAPSFTAGGEVTFRVKENTASGRNIGKRLAAVDPDGDPLTYELRGMDAPLFAIDSASGQLKTKGALDYEREDARRGGYPYLYYIVSVLVFDGRGKLAVMFAYIYLTDVAEPPGPPAGLTVTPGVESLSVSWAAPDAMAGKPPVSGYDVQYKLSSASAGPVMGTAEREPAPRSPA